MFSLFLCGLITITQAAEPRSRTHFKKHCLQFHPSIITSTVEDSSFSSTRKNMKLFYYNREFDNDHSSSYISNGGAPTSKLSKQTLQRKKLHESDDRSLLEQMRKSLGETEDVFEGAESESKQLLQGSVLL
jgi:hypothetical protein